MEVLVSGNGFSDVITLPGGEYALGIEAIEWDGASVTLQEAVVEGFANSVDPYNTSISLTRTANGPIIVASGGSKFRLSTSNYGASTEGLRLIAVRSDGDVPVVFPVSANPLRTSRTATTPLLVRRATNFSYSLDDVGELPGVNRIVFTAKSDRNENTDAASLVQVSATIPALAGTDGILVLANAPAGDLRTAGSLAWESYVINEVTKYRLVLTLKDTATALMRTVATATYDIKYFTSEGSFILDEGPLIVNHSTTRITS